MVALWIPAFAGMTMMYFDAHFLVCCIANWNNDLVRRNLFLPGHNKGKNVGINSALQNRSSNAVGFEPSQQSLPAVFRFRFAIARAIVGVKRMANAGVDVDNRFASLLLERLPHRVDVR